MPPRPPPPPRWSPLQTPWVRPVARPSVFAPFVAPPRGLRSFLLPPRGRFPCPVPPSCPVRPPCPPPPPGYRPVVDTEQLWWDTFKRTHFHADNRSQSAGNDSNEPPLRLLRRRIAQTQTLVQQLHAAAMALAAVEKKREMLRGSRMHCTEASRLHVQYECQVKVCETLKKRLEAMNATSGLLPQQQLTEIQDFARRVNQKKAYRKRAKLRRRADARIRRAIDSNMYRDAESAGDDKVASASEHNRPTKKKTVSFSLRRFTHEQQTATLLSTTPCNSSKQSLDPETLTIDALIAVRRAWDVFIVFPQTPGASTIPAHFVPPPPAPSPQWAAFVAPSPV